MTLPQDYIAEIQEIFGAETERYLQLMAQPPYKGLSVNRLKAQPEPLTAHLPCAAEKSPFYRDGYYLTGDTDGLGKHPYHQAGAFYIQEPSASSAVTLLDVQEGDKVLDLCAAPGGKSAQIASCLHGTGLLWSNEVVKNRARILLSNFERMGVREGVVSSCYPEVLCEKLGGFFDKVLVDAPCSGEGMFRKNPEAVTEWSREHVKACAERQLSILAVTVRENFGRPSGVPCGVRITQMDGGEGHFAAKLYRRDGSVSASPALRRTVKPDPKTAEVLRALSDILTDIPQERLYIMNDKVFFLPALYPDNTGLGVMRAGVFAGEWKKNRLEPAHALFMAFLPSQYRRVLNLSLSDVRVTDYLQGLEIDCGTLNGYAAVAVDGYILGFGKCSGGRLKNKYPKGLRYV